MALLKDLADNHELAHLRAALGKFAGRRLAVDGGAHRGIWTRELAKHFETVIAFEPRRELAAQIDVGTVLCVALGPHYGWCDIEDGPHNTGQGHVVSGKRYYMIPLDMVNLDQIDFLKLDVEGYELHALRGADETIRRYKPAIMVEMNGLSDRYGYTDKDLHAWLTERDYAHVGRWGRNYLYL